MLKMPRFHNYHSFLCALVLLCHSFVYSQDVSPISVSISSNGTDVIAECLATNAACNELPQLLPICYALNVTELSHYLSLYVNYSAQTEGYNVLLTGYAVNTSELNANVSDESPSFTALLPPSIPYTATLVAQNFGLEVFTGFVVCLLALGAENAPLQFWAASTSCPSKFLFDTTFSICSSTSSDVRYAGDAVCPSGICTCVAPHTKPSANTYAGLGFDDCSATVTAVTTNGSSYSTTTTLEPSNWQYFAFNASDADYDIVLTLEALNATTSNVEIYAKWYEPPGRDVGEYDLSLIDSATWLSSYVLQLSLNRSSVLINGPWYIGLYTGAGSGADVNVQLHTYDCPRGCSGFTYGTCDNSTNVCTCKKDYTGPDCSSLNRTMDLDLTSGPANFMMLPRVFAVDELHLEINQTPDQLPAAGIIVEIQWYLEGGPNATVPAWVTAYPVMSADPLGVPSHNNTQMVLPLPHAAVQGDVIISPQQLAQDGENSSVHLQITSPFPTLAVGYQLKIDLAQTCLNNCSGNGNCTRGTCLCSEGFTGADCAVNITQVILASGATFNNTLPTNDTGLAGNDTLVPGVNGTLSDVNATLADNNATLPHLPHCDNATFLQQYDPDLHATCWRGCDPDSGNYTANCTLFECDALGPNGLPQRQQGDLQQCVEDQCVGNGTQYWKVVGSARCSIECLCPEDGSACNFASDCTNGTIACADGVLTPDGRCVACQEGVMRFDHNIPGGQAYSMCVCSGDSCGFTALPSDTTFRAVVQCSDNYQYTAATYQGLVLSDGTQVVTGGACSSVDEGTSAEWVLIWCVISIILAFAIVEGCKCWWRRRKASQGGDTTRVKEWDTFTNSSQVSLANRGNGGAQGYQRWQGEA